MRNVLALVLLLATAACAQSQPRWEKSGADEKTMASDLANCRRDAHQAALSEYPYVSPSLPVSPTTAAYRDQRNSERAAMESRLTSSCMGRKGYTQVTNS